MLRIFLYLVAVALVAFTAIWVMGIEGFTEVRIGSRSISGSTAAFIGLLMFAGVLLIFGTTIVSALAGLPTRLRRRRQAKQQTRGMVALTRGLEAVAAGDAEDAQRNALLAQRNLEQPALTRLLTAQAAQLAGDDQTARESYAAMLEAPETEFLGLRGLYLQAMARGDKDEAKAYADRAFRLRPGAPWAFDSVYRLSLERGGWGDAREALLLAGKHGTQTGADAARKEAALLTAGAYAAKDSGDREGAKRDAEAALKKAPGFAPAAVLAAREEAANGKRNRALKTLDAAWAAAPHRAIARTMTDILADQSPQKRAARLRKLAAQNEGHAESRLLLAEQHVILGEYAQAQELLLPLLKDRPTAHTFAVMADAVEGQHGKAAAEPWLERAAEAPRDPSLGADGTFSLTTEGWRRLVEEYGDHARLAPPPLEVVNTALSEDDLLFLTAPPASEEAEEPAQPTEGEAETKAPEPAYPVIVSDADPSEEAASPDVSSADKVAAARRV
ncbi:heme biosynthesis protein HemY [Parvularcula dongshanensis]|uniref:HemY protein n=1 Tax=Parvularcula dongshanensis TaxID=1173995 RepID=A0A840I023_9PROT|nr:heme biosynthesis HemY N-terminal domain-containing protein [Parvularcula dongshanensis]MBB4657562.1 HemY protein [Parvularcula dongshanensis]